MNILQRNYHNPNIMGLIKKTFKKWHFYQFREWKNRFSKEKRRKKRKKEKKSINFDQI